MSTGARRWTVHLTAAAESDFEDILRWTVDQFGTARARIYADTLSAALDDLTAGPTVAGAKKRNDILTGQFTLHVARRGRKGSHFVLFRAGNGPNHDVIDILRLIHDARDLQLHLPPAEEGT